MRCNKCDCVSKASELTCWNCGHNLLEMRTDAMISAAAHGETYMQKLDRLTVELSALQSRLDAAEKENAELESALDEKNSQLSDYEYCRNEIDKARTENAELKQRCAKLEEVLTGADSGLAMIDGVMSKHYFPEGATRQFITDKRKAIRAALAPDSGARASEDAGILTERLEKLAYGGEELKLAPDSGADCGTKEEPECNCWMSGLVGHAEQCPKHKDQ